MRITFVALLLVACGARSAPPPDEPALVSEDEPAAEPVSDAPPVTAGSDEADGNGVVEPPPPPPDPDPHPGSRFTVIARVEGAGCPGEISVARACERDLSIEDVAARVIRDARALERAGLTTAEPIDFDRWILVVPDRSAELPGALFVARAPAEITGDVVTVRLSDPCEGICGGASVVELHRQECAMAHERDAWLAPRPLRELWVIEQHTSCAAALP